jgi:hypothetical protein
MATPRLTQKDMTEAEQRELKTLLDRARIAHGRTLTNAETNQVKKEYIDKLMAQRDAEAKKARKLKKSRLINRMQRRPFPGRPIRLPVEGANQRPFFLRPAG